MDAVNTCMAIKYPRVCVELSDVSLDIINI